MYFDENKKRLRVIVDLSDASNDYTKVLRKYRDCEHVDFLSTTPQENWTTIEVIKNEEGGAIESIKFDQSDTRKIKTSAAFFHHTDDILHIAGELNVTFEHVLPLYILETLQRNSEEVLTILITDRSFLLKRQNRRIPGFPRISQHSIFNIRDGLTYLDLFLKHNRIYTIAPGYRVNRGLWYLFAMKTFVPNYQAGWTSIVFGKTLFLKLEQLEDHFIALGDRLIDMISARDQIGRLYYSETNNDTQDEIIYHFNYWVSLFTGIFDSLAWISKIYLDIEVKKSYRYWFAQ